MRLRRSAYLLLGVWMFGGWGVNLWAQNPRDPNLRCQVCHGKRDLKVEVRPGVYRTLFVDYEAFQTSVHHRLRCVDCHRDVVSIPHRQVPRKIYCLQCHFAGNVVGAPVERMPEKYKESIHGKARLAGNPDAPDCQDCHTTHNVRPPDDPQSTVYKTHVIETCGKCHIRQLQDYLEGIHGQTLKKGDLAAPACNDCHQEHDVLPPDDPRSSINPENVVKTCAKCHENERLMTQRGVPVEQVETYKESFHGIALEFGMKTAANCVSCHGYHRILPRDDPQSPINPKNLAKTCGKCHPRASETVAIGSFHINPKEPSAGIVYAVSTFFKWFTYSVILGLILHILLDLYGRARRRRRTA